MLSYTSANTFPVKLLKNKDWFDNGKIKPTNMCLNPTNNCNANCSFCFCKDRDKTLELPFNIIKDRITEFYNLGGQAVVITGGGEPLMHPEIGEIVSLIAENLKVGLVTNGILLKEKQDCLDKLTWCRISGSNGFNDEWYSIIKNHNIDWAFSYVYIGKNNEIQEFINKASLCNITHIRLVTNINDKVKLFKFNNDEKVIYQDRNLYTRGAKKCWHALLRPYLDASGKWFPCCGVQYAKRGREKKMIEEMSMDGSLRDIIERQTPFDGSKCVKCYYDNYNTMIDLFIKDYKHKEFV